MSPKLNVHIVTHEDMDGFLWSVLEGWASVGDRPVYAVVLEGEAARAFTVVPEGEGYVAMQVTDV